MQQQTTTASRAGGFFLKLCSWGWGFISIVGGLSFLTQGPVRGTLNIILGMLMLPPFRRLLGMLLGVRLAQPAAFGIGAAIMVVMIISGHDMRLISDAERRQAMKIAREEDLADSALFAGHPGIDRDSLRVWRKNIADSTVEPGDTFAAFLQRQQEYHRKFVADSIVSEKQRRRDSTTAAIRAIKDSLEQVRDAQRLEIERQRLARESEPAPLIRQYSRQNSTDIYNGHQIYTGPRGGRYYINSNGNKTYVR